MTAAISDRTDGLLVESLLRCQPQKLNDLINPPEARPNYRKKWLDGFQMENIGPVKLAGSINVVLPPHKPH